MRALARLLESMGSPLSPAGKGQSATDELKNTKNVAMVMVTATIPPEGARQGEQLNCSVSAFGAKSLEGGVLLTTPLVGPRPGNPRIFATAQGSLTVSEAGPPTVAVVHDGCRLEVDFRYQFWDEQRWVTLVIDRHQAGFPTAYEIKEALSGQGGVRKSSDDYGSKSNRGNSWDAQAIDPANVRIRIPDEYTQHEVDFIAQVLDTQVALQHNDAQVTIDERNGVIVIGDNVTVGRVAVTHKNVSIQTGDEPARGPLIEITQDSDSSSTTRLQALVDALNALKVDPHSIIDIIKSLERNGDLYGRLVIE
jgi:flagellar P-ring protein precursor FlgI